MSGDSTRHRLSRRGFLRASAAVAAWASVAHLFGATARADDPPPAQPAPDEALARLLEGNARFVAGMVVNPNQTAERRVAVSTGQAPFAIILGCADSRVPPEIVFDQGIGDLFVIRIAGNIVTDEAAASLEYAISSYNTPLLMVLGHSACGAVKAAVEVYQSGAVLPGSLPHLTYALRPAVQATQGQPGDPVDNAVRANVTLGVQHLGTYDAFVAERVRNGRLKIVGGYYDLASGRVDLLA